MDEFTDKMVNELLSRCSILQLEEAVAKISKEVEKRREEIRLNTLNKFKQAFEEYVSLDPELAFPIVCDKGGYYSEIDGKEALRTFFVKNGV